MNGLTNYITAMKWEDTITQWYVLIDDAYQRGVRQGRIRERQRGPQPEVRDSEIITLGVVIETYFQGHEEVGYAFIQQYLGEMFPRQLALAWFNVRRRGLVAEMEIIRQILRDQLLTDEAQVRVVDSFPIELMTYTRGSRSQSAIGEAYFGYVASKAWHFFGLRLHATVTEGQLIDQWLLAPASIHDVTLFATLVSDQTHLTFIGDKAYNHAALEAQLWDKHQLLLLPLRRVNQAQQWSTSVRRALGKVRHRVETVFSVLTTTFNIQRPRARSLQGHVTRITTCVLAYTLAFCFP